MERRLAAILAADVVGYSRLMELDETGTLAALNAHRDSIINPSIAEHHGRVVKLMGDGILAEFPSVVGAVQCAAQIQAGLAKKNANVPEELRMDWRIGINVGDVVVEGDDIYGDGINIASRLEGLAEPGGICISRDVFTQVKNKVDLGFESLGEQTVKNIAEPVLVFRVELSPGATMRRSEERPQTRWWRSIALPAAVTATAVAGALVVWTYFGNSNAPQPLPDKPSIAVLPFVNLSGDPGQEMLAGGLTEDIIIDLSQFPDMVVIDRQSVSTYKGKPVKAQQVSRELGVHYVLTGSIQEATGKVRISVQLVDATTGHQLWADRYDREYSDIFALQDEITQKIAWTIAGYSTRSAETAAAENRFEGTGTVVTVEAGNGRVLLDHGEIKDFMAPMVMSYQVTPPALLEAINAGDKVRFAIDPAKRMIVAITPLAE
jgi:TolB-like protein/class 3 adenylate cyclase